MKRTVNTVTVFDWDDNSKHKIITKRLEIEGDYRYVIEVDGAFWCTAEMFSEVYSEINDIIKLYNWKLIPTI